MLLSELGCLYKVTTEGVNSEYMTTMESQCTETRILRDENNGIVKKR